MNIKTIISNWKKKRNIPEIRKAAWNYYAVPTLEKGEQLWEDIELWEQNVEEKVKSRWSEIHWPKFKLPKFNLLKSRLPKIKIPKLSRPSSSRSQWKIPRLKVAMPSMPKINFSLDRKKVFAFALQTVRMAVFSVLLFAIGFFTINAGAYSEITMAWITQLSGEQQESQLEQFVDKHETPEQALLAVTSIPEEQRTQLPELSLSIAPPDMRLIIPKIDKNVPIIISDPAKLVGADWESLQDTFQDDLKNGVIQYPGTAKPGEVGNVFITGHSSYYIWDAGRYKNVFARLNQLEVGDDIIVYSDQEKYHYKVREIKEVSSDDISVLEQGDERILTLMTCTPVGTNINRLVVIAEQI